MANSTKISENCDIIDIFSVNSNVLVAYSFGLVFGTPTLTNKKVTFEAFKYLHFEHIAFADWWEFIFSVTAFNILDEKERNFEHNKQKYPIEIAVYKDYLEPKNNTTYQWTAICTERYHLSIEITAIGLEKTVFLLQPHDLIIFVQGFEALFFKVYLYPPKIHYTIKSTLEDIHIKIIENIQNHDFNDILKCFQAKLNEEEAYYATEIVLRHRKFMCNWQKILPILHILC